MNPDQFAAAALAASRDFARPRPMRRGSVSVRRICCHKPGCACASDPERRHGPYVSVVQGGGRNTKSRWIPPELEPLVRKQVEEARSFQDQVNGFLDACERWADAELEQAALPEAAEKKGSRKRSKRRSSRKSKR